MRNFRLIRRLSRTDGLVIGAGWLHRCAGISFGKQDLDYRVSLSPLYRERGTIKRMKIGLNVVIRKERRNAIYY
jgi:hypothetical protein